MELYGKSGMLHTCYENGLYGEGITVTENISGLCVSVKKTGGDIRSGSGKIYISAANPSAGRIATAGEYLGGSRVRYQNITVDGFRYAVKSVKKIYRGSALHHIEIDVG
ncbi:MAG: hypothetical protein II664_09415 [Oscillospiraceae bacterium]|nr:hypothetical protein [Oscillospiraceae bacterium]